MRYSLSYFMVPVMLTGLMVFLISKKNKNVLYGNNAPNVAAKTAFVDSNQCILSHLQELINAPEKIWNKFEMIIEECIRTTNVSKIKLAAFPNKDEIKHYILSNEVDEPSVVVSLGIGVDVLAEEALKKVLPKGSEFFGADPVIAPNEELFSKIGKFFPYAVSSHSGFYESDIRLNNGDVFARFREGYVLNGIKID